MSDPVAAVNVSPSAAGDCTRSPGGAPEATAAESGLGLFAVTLATQKPLTDTAPNPQTIQGAQTAQASQAAQAVTVDLRSPAKGLTVASPAMDIAESASTHSASKTAPESIQTPKLAPASQGAPAVADVPVQQDAKAPPTAVADTPDEQAPPPTRLSTVAAVAQPAEAPVVDPTVPPPAAPFTVESSPGHTAMAGKIYTAMSEAGLRDNEAPKLQGPVSANRPPTAQVGARLDTAIVRGETRLQMQLHPAELGRVDVDLQANGSRLTVTLTATSTEAEQALRDGIPELTDALVRRGGRYQSVDIRFDTHEEQRREDDRASGQKRNTARGNESEDQQRGRGSHRPPRDTAEAWADLAQGG